MGLFMFGLWIEYQDRELSRFNMTVGRAVTRLRKIEESLVAYTNGAVDRVLNEMDDTQAQLAQALKLHELAQQLGTTLLTAG